MLCILLERGISNTILGVNQGLNENLSTEIARKDELLSLISWKLYFKHWVLALVYMEVLNLIKSISCLDSKYSLNRCLQFGFLLPLRHWHELLFTDTPRFHLFNEPFNQPSILYKLPLAPILSQNDNL